MAKKKAAKKATKDFLWGKENRRNIDHFATAVQFPSAPAVADQGGIC
jgi:hypothetical protein